MPRFTANRHASASMQSLPSSQLLLIFSMSPPAVQCSRMLSSSCCPLEIRTVVVTHRRHKIRLLHSPVEVGEGHQTLRVQAIPSFICVPSAACNLTSKCAVSKLQQAAAWAHTMAEAEAWRRGPTGRTELAWGCDPGQGTLM